VKALRLHGVGDLRLHDEPSPGPSTGEVLLSVRAVGLCGSDRHWFSEGAIGDARLDRPLVLGHEFVATIESGPRRGERVAVDPADPCGRCAPCLAGMNHLCLHVRFAGHGATDGALRSLMTWPEALLHPIPDAIPDAEGALLEPLGVALHALDLGRAGPGVSAGVFGCGPIGLLLIRALRAAGASVELATDLLLHRVEAATGSGAAHGILAREGAVAAACGDGAVGPGLDVAFEAAGENAAIDDAITATRPGGRVVLVGIPADDRTGFTASPARRKGLTLLVSRRMRGTDLPRAVGLVASGRVELASLVSGRYALEEWRDAFAALGDRRGLKVVVDPRRPNTEPSA
jgi:L-iditol 2-dehydrogenase